MSEFLKRDEPTEGRVESSSPAESAIASGEVESAIGESAVAASIPGILALNVERFKEEQRRSDEIARKMAERSPFNASPILTLNVERFEEERQQADEIMRRMADRSSIKY